MRALPNRETKTLRQLRNEALAAGITIGAVLAGAALLHALGVSASSNHERNKAGRSA
jgi:hypothetical protein